MATVREGSKPVLLVVDVQVDVVKGAWDTTRIVGNVALAVERARSQGVPVIWVQQFGIRLENLETVGKTLRDYESPVILWREFHGVVLQECL